MRNFFRKYWYYLPAITIRKLPKMNSINGWWMKIMHPRKKMLWESCGTKRNGKKTWKECRSLTNAWKTGRYSNRTQREKNSPNTYMAIRSRYLIPPACLFGLSIDCRRKSGNRLITAIYSDSRNEKFDAARRNKSATQLEKYTFISAGVYRR